MIITIPKEDWERQMAHLDSLEPQTQQEFDEITVLLDIVNQSKNDCQVIVNQPKLTLVKG